MLFRVVSKEHNAVRVAEVTHGEPTIGQLVNRSRIASAKDTPLVQFGEPSKFMNRRSAP